MNLPQNIFIFKEQYVDHMDSNPTISQHIERYVKRCNHMVLESRKNRDENNRSMYAMTNIDMIRKKDYTREDWVRNKCKGKSILNYKIDNGNES